MQRREFILALSLLPAFALSINRERTCPLCGGKLTFVAAVKDNPSGPSVNLEVWNRSYHGEIAEPFSKSSFFCQTCYFAYEETSMKWLRSSEVPDSFQIPLLPELRQFPISGSRPDNLRIVYTQAFSGPDASQGRIESIMYWAYDSEYLRSELESYSNSHDLKLVFYTAPSMSGQVSIKAETPNNSFKPTPLRGAA